MNSFLTRLSALFLVLLLGMVAVVGWLSITAADRFVNETEQKLNQDLAATMAVDFQPFLEDSIDNTAIHDRIAYLMRVNPRIDIYLLGSNGMIKALFVNADRSPDLRVLDTEPMDRMLAGAPLPILGDDPLEPGVRKPFSVAPIEIMGEEGCYLYVVLGGAAYQTTAGMVRESYILRTLARSVGIALLITVLLGTVLFALLTRRLRLLGDAVRDFEKGDYARRADLSGNDEIGQLAGVFNEMADTLQANVKELERTDQLRRELVANVSHDLRSPLSSIQGYLETILIKSEDLPREELMQYVDTGLKATRRLSALIGELFELSKLDANQVELNPERFSMTDLVQDVAMQFQPRAEAADIKLEVNLPDHVPLVYGDIALVERAICNLIENAIRFTRAGGVVSIEPAVTGEGLRVQVKDTGVGIAPDKLPRIFDRFYRVEDSRQEQFGGAGLGLAIAKRIVELHRSTLSVRSELDKGTTFSFILPFWSAETVPQPA